MKIISSIFLILIPIFCFTQSNQSIDIVSGIDYYRTTGANSDDIKILEEALSSFLHSEDIETLEELNAIKRGKVNWMVGVNYNKRIDDKLFFKLGLRIANLGFDKIVQTGIISFTVDPVTLETTPKSSSVNSINFTNNYWFLDIPAAIRFESSEKKFSSFFEIGASSLIYLTHRKSQESILGTRFFPDDQFHFDYFNRIRWVGFVSFGFNYNLYEKLQIFAQPIFRYNITPLAGSFIIHDHLLTAGLELGIRKKF